jgi:hypothetical protein
MQMITIKDKVEDRLDSLDLNLGSHGNNQNMYSHYTGTNQGYKP